MPNSNKHTRRMPNPSKRPWRSLKRQLRSQLPKELNRELSNILMRQMCTIINTDTQYCIWRSQEYWIVERLCWRWTDITSLWEFLDVKEECFGHLGYYLLLRCRNEYSWLTMDLQVFGLPLHDVHFHVLLVGWRKEVFNQVLVIPYRPFLSHFYRKITWLEVNNM